MEGAAAAAAEGAGGGPPPEKPGAVSGRAEATGGTGEEAEARGVEALLPVGDDSEGCRCSTAGGSLTVAGETVPSPPPMRACSAGGIGSSEGLGLLEGVC